MQAIRTLQWALSLLVLASPLAAQLSSRVLIVYNSHPTYAAESLDVAEHYRAERGIPVSNLCPVSFSNFDNITTTEWVATQRTAVRACLNAVPGGRGNILYIVLSYRVPVLLLRPSPPAYASLDSHVADIWDTVSTQQVPDGPSAHRYYLDAQSHGNVYAPFQSLASYRTTPRAAVIYSVWRLWGANATAAKNLVLKAKATEAAGGLTGTAYFDRRFNYVTPLTSPDDSGYGAGDIDLDNAARFVSQTGRPMHLDLNPEEFGTAPALTTVPNAALYAGWYSFNTYFDVFTWNQGAIGWHLDSASAGALNSASPTSWVPRALERGITVTAGSVTEPYLEGLPHPDVTVRHLLQGGNVGDAFLRGTPYLRWKIIFVGDPLYVPYPSGSASLFSSEPSLRLNPRLIVNGGTPFAIVNIGAPAPSGGKLVALSTNQPALLPGLPASVTVPAGATSATISLGASSAVTSDTYVLLRADYDSVQLRNTLGIFPLLNYISFAQQVTGPATVNGAVVLNSPAPLGGAVVTLSSSHPAISVPASVTVPTGALVAYFPMTASAVGSATPVEITATLAGASRKAMITVNP